MTYPAPKGVPHDDWFDNPLDSMPIATDNPRPEEEVADNITMHEKMYRIATSRYNPFSVGGSENCDSDIECVYEPGNILDTEEWHDEKPG